MGVARKYLVNTNSNNSDETNYHISLIKIASEIQSKARNNATYPWINQNFNNATSIDLFGGKFEMYKYNFSQKFDKILPTPILGFDKQRLIIIRPKDNIQRPCVLVTHGLGTCTNTEDPFYDYAMDYLSIPDLLMRGYCVVYYENISTCRNLGNIFRYGYIETNYKLTENVNVESSYWQRWDLLALLNSTAAAKFTAGISQKINISPYLYTLGHSFGGFTSLNLALADPGLNYNDPIFTYLTDNNPNFTYFTLDEFKDTPFSIIGATSLCSILPDPTISINKIGDFFDNSDKYVGISMINGKNDQLVPFDYSSGVPNPNSPWKSTQSLEGPLRLINRMNPLGMNNALFVNCYADHLIYAKPASFDHSQADFTTIINAINSNSNFPTGISANVSTKWNGFKKYHQQQYEFDSYSTILYQLYLFQFISICFDANGLPTPCIPHFSTQEYVRPQSCTAYPMVCASNPNDSWQLTTCNPATGNRLANNNDIDIEATTQKIEFFQKEFSLLSANPKLPLINNKEIGLINEFDILPNPANNLITIKYSIESKHNTEIQIIDLTGKIIMNQKTQNDIKSIDIDVSNLPNSVYLVRLINDKKVYTKKFIKN
ncbi:MAG TPA: T9SS type A sorting domain-containing protein [Chitinophagales bacterium]|nr:T9SS type A sorting domain-containing protein [Chitinophagales bacterium]